ncbi:bifunctional hydroxymethylpyrimidine kinase/phosphomethylpyrimidine kinase [Snodgrassella communis]|uniref:bifunctional hydroxymethylpyrimidine kinase/phosphomethylpyrimidine kinase n=1 Tax=Snodgrassella communis TaxID=2946699 RepID=UPI001EF59D68|nr:bifunctional hydroxymethylpyrimidine kinase/phosphomethylpyrimidine kinase [Snodgrassella communis]WMY91420.1 bifunctional hydroxymethylpyrimidine kinase/phosphomethylpyrimidine kinase [Snodgrassella communis]
MVLAKPYPRAMTIAGSDSSGGAGIQADLKTFAALGAYGTSVITAITAQNTFGVQQVMVVPPNMIEAQCAAVMSDIRIDAVKIGMLADVESIHTVAEVLQQYHLPFTVLDPVMVATSGSALSIENTVQALKQRLMPLADVLTPNLFELSTLTHRPIATSDQEMLEQGQILLDEGCQAVLVKGGHRNDSEEAADWLLEVDCEPVCFKSLRIKTSHTHGTGCTLSAAIAALRPKHENLVNAVAAAKSYVHGAIDAGQHWHLGHGYGPLAHFWRIKRD